MNTYKVGVLEAKKEIIIHKVFLKSPAEAQVLIKIDSCAICTLEQRVFSGVLNRYPFAGGHEVSGVVTEIGRQVTSIAVGDHVTVRLLTACGECYYCRSGHENQCVKSFIANTQENWMGPGGLAEYITVDASKVYKIANDVDLSHAALTEPLACCVHSVKRASIQLGNDVVVIGVGIMGAMHIQLAKLQGARVIACEMDQTRLIVAKQMGADIIIDCKKDDLTAKILQITEGRGADVVFCTAAVVEAAKTAIDIVGKTGKVLFYSSFHPDLPIPISPNKIHSTEIIVTGAVNPQIKDFLAAARLLSHRLIDVSLLITDKFSLEHVHQAFEASVSPSSYRVIVKC